MALAYGLASLRDLRRFLWVSIWLLTVAEGVEDKDTSDWLLEHGCVLQQGFVFSPPVEPVEISGILDELPVK